MTTVLVFEQLLNGLQFGVMLFLMAAGADAGLRIMNLVNLAHRLADMGGAYLTVPRCMDRVFPIGVLLGLLGTWGRHAVEVTA